MHRDTKLFAFYRKSILLTYIFNATAESIISFSMLCEYFDYTCIVHEVKHLLKQEPRFSVVSVDRSVNQVGHSLANLGRSPEISVTWPSSGPENVIARCLQEASPVA